MLLGVYAHLGVSKSEQFFSRRLGHHRSVKTSDLTIKQALSIECPVCFAKPGDRCQLGSGELRITPHGSRELAVLRSLEETANPRWRMNLPIVK
jgi:hypothetical protein